MDIILQSLLLVVSISFCIGDIVVTNKITEKVIAKVDHNLLLSEVDEYERKVD